MKRYKLIGTKFNKARRRKKIINVIETIIKFITVVAHIIPLIIIAEYIGIWKISNIKIIVLSVCFLWIALYNLYNHIVLDK